MLRPVPTDRVKQEILTVIHRSGIGRMVAVLRATGQKSEMITVLGARSRRQGRGADRWREKLGTVWLMHGGVGEVTEWIDIPSEFTREVDYDSDPWGHGWLQS